MTRETALFFALVVTTLLLASLTWGLTRVRKPDVLAWSLLAMLYVVMGALFSINRAVLDFDLHGCPLDIVPALAVVFIAAIAVTVIAVASKRGANCRAMRTWSRPKKFMARCCGRLVFALLTAVEVGVIAVIPLGGLRWVMASPALLLLAAAALAWGGFHYRFSGHGVEISTLGFRLRSIPLENIKAYAIAPWNPMGGYGIRGIGERRAYVWGNTGVRLMLSDGEVFLGHREPEKIMKDLNLIRQNQKARENT